MTSLREEIEVNTNFEIGDSEPIRHNRPMPISDNKIMNKNCTVCPTVTKLEGWHEWIQDGLFQKP